MRFGQRFLTGVLAILLLAGFAAQGAAQAAATTLQSAAARGLVEYSFEGTGASSGDSVRVKVKRNPRAPDPFPITIPPGTILRSGGAEQSMVVSSVRGIDAGGRFFQPAAQIVLNGSAWVTAILSAFCAEFEKDNPSASTQFTLEPPDTTLACVLSRSRNLSVAAQQAAVWMHTDRLTYRHMNEKFPVSQGDWAAAESVVRACMGAVPGPTEVARPAVTTREAQPTLRFEPPPPIVRLEPSPPRVMLQPAPLSQFQRGSTSITELMSRLNGYWQGKSESDGNFNDGEGKPYHVVETFDLAVQIIDVSTGAMSAQFNHHETFTEKRGRPWSRDYRVDIELVVGQIDDSISARVVAAEVRLNNRSSKLAAAVVRKLGIEQGILPGDRLRVDIRYDANNWKVALMNKY